MVNTLTGEQEEWIFFASFNHFKWVYTSFNSLVN